MSRIARLAGNVFTALVIAAVGVAAMDPGVALAQAPGQTETPPQWQGFRLERTWLREQRIYDRLGFMFDHSQQRIDAAQDLIDQAKANGKDVAAVQAALDAFADALQKARPIYESGKGLIASHQGFDANGRVTDQEQATQTVKALGDKLKEVRSILEEPGRALRDAVRDFREANGPK